MFDNWNKKGKPAKEHGHSTKGQKHYSVTFGNKTIA
jgi:hypothetical protein